MDAKQQAEALVARAREAQRQYETFTQAQVDTHVRAIAKFVYDNAEQLAKMAVEESGMGLYEDKVAKNKGKARIIWNHLRDKKSVGIVERDPEKGLITVARPMGVVAAVTPCTNPIVTPMCNSMFALKGRNAIIIAPHPRAKKCAKYLVEAFMRLIPDAPEHLIQVLEEPSTEGSAALMQAADVVVATGGMPMVRAAYSSGKPAYGVGVGNVQCILDRGVSYMQALEKIVAGRCFDNGIICSAEQMLFVPEEDLETVLSLLLQLNTRVLRNPDEVENLRKAVFPQGIMNKKLVGVSAAAVAKEAGIACAEDARALVVLAAGYGARETLAKEKMCPVLGVYPYRSFEEAVEMAQANLDVDGRGHSVSIHSDSAAHLEYAAERLTVARVLVNQICATSNGGSFFNALTPTTTLGCASWGENSISENLDYRHLINYIRIACPIQRPIPSDAELWG